MDIDLGKAWKQVLQVKDVGLVVMLGWSAVQLSHQINEP